MIPVRVAQEKNTRNAADSTKRRHCGAHRMVAKKLRKEAEDCRREAERASDPADKEFWLRIAAGWIELAKDAGKQKPS